jgi:pimeloyl-ACP methyl ester carboxylesterase
LISSYLRVSNTITLHYRDNQAASLPPLLLLHSLSDNTYAFDAIIAAGLSQNFRVIAPDLRGRGESSRPHSGYTLEDHCADIIAILDELGLERANIAGHSFGALLGLYFAAHYPERMLGLTMLDAAAELHPLTPMFLLAAGTRLGKWYLSEQAYISSVRAAPYFTFWDVK